MTRTLFAGAAAALLLAATPAAARANDTFAGATTTVRLDTSVAKAFKTTGADSRAAATWTYGATTLKLDPGAVAALTGLGVAPAPIAPASVTRAGEFAFPITNPPFAALASGTIRHGGGIALTAGSTTVKLENFNIDPLHRQLTALVGGARVPILDLDFSRTRIDLDRGALRVGPVGGALTAVAAGALDSAFGLASGTIPPGLKLGDATIRYRLF